MAMDGETENLTPVLTWLAEAALRNKPVDATLAGTCERLNALGYEIARGHVSTAALHPMIESYSITWSVDHALERLVLPHGHTPTPGWLQSPLHHMLTTRELFYRRLLIERTDGYEFPVFQDFADEGMTDWMAIAEGFSHAADHVPGGEFGIIVSWTTKAPRGFRQDRIGGLKLVTKTLAVAIKSNFMNEIAHDVLGAYLGADAAQRVLTGAITRGGITEMPAVVMMADIRGFTRISLERPIGEVVAMLNGAFDVVSDAVTTHGGTVLKLMGDGALAIFLLRDRARSAVAKDAADAAAAIQKTLPDGVAMNIGLSVGDVHYGNIGAAGRLDFTAIGTAVNEAARLEALGGALNEPLLVSAEIAGLLANEDVAVKPVGHHLLKGFDQPREVYAIG